MNIKIIFYLIFLTLTFFSCKSENSNEEKQTNTNKNSSLSDESIYNLESEWVNQDGKTIKLDTLKGKTVVAAMMFTYCKAACPRIVADMQRIEKETANVPNVNYLLISMDPKRDTPERFREFAKESGLNKNWTMVSSSQETTDEMANVLSVKVKKLNNEGFDHSNTIFLIDQGGNIAYVQEGFEQNQQEIIKKINELNKQ